MTAPLSSPKQTMKPDISLTKKYINKTLKHLEYFIVEDFCDFEFNLLGIDDDKYVSKLLYEKNINNKTEMIIYQFSIRELNTAKKLKTLFPQKRSNKYKICTNNPHKTNTTLYVGSSNKEFHKRFKQHVGTNGHGTYGMHLKLWVSPDFWFTPIRLQCWRIRTKVPLLQEIQQFGLQALEDDLWDRTRPLFGKRGGK